MACSDSGSDPGDDVKRNAASPSSVRRRAAAFLLFCQLLLVGCPTPLDLAGDRSAADSPASNSERSVPEAPQARKSVRLVPLGRFRHGGFGKSAAEILAYHPGSKRLFVVNAEAGAIDVLSIADPERPEKLRPVDVQSLGTPTSVAVHGDVIAASVASKDKRRRGRVVFLSSDGKIRKTLTVGYEPDMLTFTRDGRWLLVANEGEPTEDYAFDPEGTISQIDVSGGVDAIGESSIATLDFRRFNDQADLFEQGIRIFGPKATVAQDLEPEYIAVAPDSKTAWVVCQENNAVGIIDLEAKRIVKLVGLGFKDHSREGNGFDASDKDKQIRIRPWPVWGMYQPDAVAAFSVDGRTFLITANEGKDRTYAGFNERVRVADLKLDPAAFPNARDLQQRENLGRLRVTRAHGDDDGDGLHERLFVFGGRSFSIWTDSVEQVFDSGDQFERIVAANHPGHFNSNHEKNNFDGRSDAKGPEPEGLTVANIEGRTIAFIGLERIGGILIYDVGNPNRPVFEDYVNPRTFTGKPAEAGEDDLGPEGLLFIPKEKSPVDAPLLAVSHEVSGTTRIYRVEVDAPASSPDPRE